MSSQKKLIIEPHYLGSVEYFTLLSEFSTVCLEVNQHYTKQTFKNRFYILSAQGSLKLSVPVKYNNRTPLKEVKIDASHSWQKDHWGAIYSSYGKSPFFEYFADSFHETLSANHRYLIDLSTQFMTLCLNLLKIDIDINLSEEYSLQAPVDCFDGRELILPKKSFEKRRYLNPKKYSQNFGNEFVPNLSVIDLLFCEGPMAGQIINESVFAKNEHL